MRDSANSLRSTFSPSLDPPIALSADFELIGGETLVTFNHPMQSGFYDTGNWFIRWNNQSFPVDTAEVEPGDQPTLILTHGIQGGDVGPNVVTYSPPPFDILSATTKPIRLEAFSIVPF